MKSNIYILIALLTLGVLNIGYCQISIASENESQSKEIHIKDTNDLILIDIGHFVEKYNSANPIEKVYLHFDRDVASTGDNLWYTAYLTHGAYHNLSDAVLYVDLINDNNKVVINQTQALVDGRSNGSMTIPKELPLGNYRLRAYTKWMTNSDSDFFFYKTLTITDNQSITKPAPRLNDSIHLRFFPEGGQLVENLPCRVAFKALGGDGSGKEIRGHIVDATDKIVCSIDSTPQGFGTFYLLPERSNTYKAVLDDGSIYDLPSTLEQGYSMSVNNLDFEKIKVRVKASDVFQNRPFYAIGTSRGQKVFQAKFRLNEDSYFDFEVPKDDLLSGVLTITLFDENKRPRCERLVFIDNQQKFKVKVTTPGNSSYTERAPISIRINVTDQQGRPVSTQLSIAVTDADYIEKDENGRNILSYLLLESDIKGHIESPNTLFKDTERSTLHNLDLVMMTHGWRKYKWQDVIKGIDPSKKADFEEGITVSGTAYGRGKKPLANTSIKMIGLADIDFFAYPAITDGLGYFKIHNVAFQDSVRVMFNGYNKRNKPIDVDITLDQNDIFPVGELDSYPISDSKKEEIDLFKETNYIRGVDDFIFDNVTELDEVVVTEQKVERKESPSTYGIIPDAVVYQDENKPQDLSLLLRTFSGVFVIGDEIGARIGSIRGSATSSFTSDTGPLWLIDGTKINTKFSPFEFLSSSDIERIEILKGPETTIFGASGSNGVILIYTKRGKPSLISPPSKSNFEHVLAHTGEKEFYSPDYDKPNNEQKKVDNRKTLFWDPSVTTNENGDAAITFFNSDFAEKMQVVIDFLTEQGAPGFYINTFLTGEY